MLKYCTGETILVGDIIRTEFAGKYRYGVVEIVMLPHTQEAKDGDCFDKGGILMRLCINDGFTYLSDQMPDEIEFLFRASVEIDSGK